MYTPTPISSCRGSRFSKIFRGKNDEEVGNEADERGEDEREEEDGEVSRVEETRI